MKTKQIDVTCKMRKSPYFNDEDNQYTYLETHSVNKHGEVSDNCKNSWKCDCQRVRFNRIKNASTSETKKHSFK